MVFFDTCIWIELCAARTPITEHEIHQAVEASNLLSKVMAEREIIVTCNEQLLEIISAIQKIKMREYNRICRQNLSRGAGSLKEFRNTDDFMQTQNLCRQAVQDVCHLAKNDGIMHYIVNDVLDNIHLADINDYLYFQHCLKNSIDFYTFDSDFLKLGDNNKIHIIY